MRPVEALLITITVILLLYIQFNHAHCFVFRMMYVRWTTECFTVLTAAMMRARNRRQRRLLRAPYAWSVPRPVESWFDLHYYDPTIPQEFFRQQLRVTRNTFNQILNTLNHRLVRQQSRFRDPLPPEKILALGLYRLGHGNSYVSIGPSFNVGKATVIEAVQDVVEALYEIRNEHIKFPENEAETRAAIETFQDLSDLPNIVGAIDGSHVRIKAPKDGPVDYFSRYQQHDFIIQAVVNGQKLFLDFACGYPGSMHDARVLRRSSIFRRAEGGDILIAPTVNINGNEIGPYLVGDSAYPLSPWLMKPYPEGTRDRAEIKFNKELSSARVKVECAFGLIKSRWRILQKRFDSTIDFAVKNAIACAVLHNLCIRLGDNWEEEDGDDNYPCPPIAGPNIIRDADNMREILKDYIQ